MERDLTNKRSHKMSPENNHEVKRRHRSRGFWAFVLVAGLVGAVLVGGAIVSTQASGFFGHSGHGHRGHFTNDPEMAREHAELAASFVLARIDATDDQKEQVQVIVGSGVEDLVALAQQHRENHEAWRIELSKPTIDRAALEELRKNGIELADTASTRLVEALAGAAEVLTPEQRSELMEMADRFHKR